MPISMGRSLRASRRVVFSRQRLNEYLDQITLQVSANATNNRVGRSPRKNSAAISAAQQQNQNVINSLRQVRATGVSFWRCTVDANQIYRSFQTFL